MNKLLRSITLICAFVVTTVLPLRGQVTTQPAADSNATTASATPTGQAPDDVLKRLSDLVHAGKYAEAQGLTTGLLLAYPEDRRLIKAKALLDKTLASSKLVDPAESSNPPTRNVTPAQPATNTNFELLTGMDKVDYNALISLVRQAQQTTDLEEQKKLLQQFMDQSSLFLQKHPKQMLLLQLRVASAISLNQPMAGYEAGQILLGAGAADSNDPVLQQLLVQLRNKGWLNKQEVENANDKLKYAWIVGAWKGSFNMIDRKGRLIGTGPEEVDFYMSDSEVDGYRRVQGGTKRTVPELRINVLDSGQIRCETTHSPKVWDPISCGGFEVGDENRTMRIAFVMKEVEEKYGYKYSWELHKE